MSRNWVSEADEVGMRVIPDTLTFPSESYAADLRALENGILAAIADAIPYIDLYIEAMIRAAYHIGRNSISEAECICAGNGAPKTP